jgi:hypothetical protein
MDSVPTNEDIIQLMTKLGHERSAICGYYGGYDGNQCCSSFVPRDSDDAPWDTPGLSTNDLRLFAAAVIEKYGNQNVVTD